MFKIQKTPWMFLRIFLEYKGLSSGKIRQRNIIFSRRFDFYSKSLDKRDIRSSSEKICEISLTKGDIRVITEKRVHRFKWMTRTLPYRFVGWVVDLNPSFDSMHALQCMLQCIEIFLRILKGKVFKGIYSICLLLKLLLFCTLIGYFIVSIYMYILKFQVC